MALAITAPVVVTHSGEADPALTPQMSMGSPLADIVGTSTTSGGNLSIKITQDGAPDVTVVVVASTFAFTTAGKLTYVPNTPGMLTIAVTDVTAATTVTTTVEVFQSAGV